jgi:hypothetical protein
MTTENAKAIWEKEADKEVERCQLISLGKAIQQGETRRV